MPVLLADPPNDGYVSLRTIFIGSQDPAAEQGSDGQADFRYTLPNYLTNAIALEMDNYSVPVSCLSQFTERNRLDFRLRNPAIFGGNWKVFELVLPSTAVLYSTPESRAADLLTLLFRSFQDLILQDPDFGGKVDILPIADPNTFVKIACRTLFYDDPSWPGYGSTECEFLFGTGANKAKSVASILGFDDVDVAFQPLNYFGFPVRFTSSSREASINLYRYIDVFLDEFSLTEVFYRVFVPSINSVALTYPEINSRARLLSVPIRKALTLTFHLRLPDGAKPQTPQPFYFNIKVFTLEGNQQVPDVQQTRAQYL
jgi:hypothetical protein